MKGENIQSAIIKSDKFIELLQLENIPCTRIENEGVYSINDKPICIDDSTRPTLFNSSGNSSYSVTYDKISTNTPDFYNALCLYLSDDSSLNDGSFYITLEVCANSVVK